MKNIWKWVVGIVLVVVIVGGLVGAAFVLHNTMAANFSARANLPAGSAPNVRPNPGVPGGPGFFRPGMRGRFPGNGGPMMFGRGFGFSPVFFLFGGLTRLVPLALVILLIVGAYLLGKRAQPAVAPAAAPLPTHACPKCGNAVQDDSKYCPSCGKKQ